ncbi:MAG: hypothetical protein D6678_06595 [Zetaproteobacteria bacterium]|nr:MAG: hypothetical protein D6678_06595 [Zetaproteobacteria bacterium]
MLLLLFIVLSVPIGGFAVWLAWKAHRAGKRNAMLAMGWLAVLSFVTALLTSGWMYALWQRHG